MPIVLIQSTRVLIHWYAYFPLLHLPSPHQNLLQIADDVADNVLYAASRPSHVQIAEIVVYPTNQASVEHVHRTA
jgi:hypothetical protein